MIYPKLGTKIVLDEKKIISEQKYDLDKIYAYLDGLAKKLTLTKTDKYTYMTQGNSKDLSNLMIFTYLNLMNEKWFVDNIKEWLWLEDNGDYATDMLKKRNFSGKKYASA